MKSMPAVRLVSMIILCGFSFFRYLRSAGLSGGTGMIILSTHEGANYGRSDVRSATTLISLRRLDLIKHLEMFVSSLVSLISPETSFVGCFAQEENSSAFGDRPERNGRVMTGIFRHRHAGYRLLNRDRVSALLEGNGLEVIDMKEMNGLTYFHSRKKESLTDLGEKGGCRQGA